MYICTFDIDGYNFTGAFANVCEISDFIDDCEKDGESVVINEMKKVTPEELLAHPSFQGGDARNSALAVIRTWFEALTAEA